MKPEIFEAVFRLIEISIAIITVAIEIYKLKR